MSSECGETFSSHHDSSPMSSLDENVENYLELQYENVESVIGQEATKRLQTIRDKLSHIPLTIFDVYRMFYVF